MLSGLDDISWGSVEHAYGPATDVPDMLRGLASEDPGLRETALRKAFGNIWHQGTVYEATALAVPFLIEIAAAAPRHGRGGVLDLLWHIAQGTSYHDVHQHLAIMGERMRNEPGFDEQLARELEWVRAATEAVAAGGPTYVRLLSTDPDPLVRRACARLLSACDPAIALGALHTATAQDPDAGARATALFAIAALEREEAAPRLHEALADATPLVRLAAALASAFCLESGIDVGAVDVLLEFLDSSAAVDYTAFQFGENQAGDIGRALTSAEAEMWPTIAARLLAVAKAGGTHGLYVAEPLLQLTLTEPRPDLTVDALTPLERDVLTYVAGQTYTRVEGRWSVFANLSSLLRAFAVEDVAAQLVGYPR